MVDSPEIVSFGEPMVELAAAQPGPLRDATEFRVGWGGDTSNFAVAAARLGRRCGYVTRLGDDEFGASLRALWDREGIDASTVPSVDDGHTAAYFLSRQAVGAHAFTYFRHGSAASRFTEADLPMEYIRGAQVFHTSGITQAISTTACDAALRAIREARDAGVMTTYDPNVREKLWPIERARAIVLHTIGLVDIALPNIEEARRLTGLTEPEDIAAALLELGPRTVVLKLGGDGALVADEAGVRHVPAYPVDSVDAAGAGDTFDAGFIVGLLDGLDAGQAADFANAAAALTTTGLGCVAPIPHRDAVESLRYTDAS